MGLVRSLYLACILQPRTPPPPNQISGLYSTYLMIILHGYLQHPRSSTISSFSLRFFCSLFFLMVLLKSNESETYISLMCRQLQIPHCFNSSHNPQKMIEEKIKKKKIECQKSKGTIRDPKQMIWPMLQEKNENQIESE